MSNPTNYKIQNGTPWQVLDDAVIILAPQSRMAHELDDTGSFVWLGLTKGHTLEQISKDLTEEFDVDFETAQRDVSAFVAELETKKLLERA